MDPITLILGALAAGAAASAQSVASDAIKDTYAGLKKLIQQRFAGNARAQAALTDHEDDPETYKLPLKKALQQEHADQDERIMQEAKRLMELLEPEEAAKGKFSNIRIGQAQGTILGDHANQTNYFGDQPRTK